MPPINKGSVGSLAQDPAKGKKPLLINPKQIVFYTVFFFVFCFSGVIIMSGMIPYRMGFVSFLVIPLIILYGFKITRVVIVYALLTGIIFLSGIINGSSFLEILLFMRILIFSFLIFVLVEMYVNSKNIARIMRLCVVIALIQLPVVIIQKMLYTRLPARLIAQVSSIDFGFGTFNFKADAQMAFFVTLVIAFLLFVDRKNQIVRRKWLVLLWLTLTVIIMNAEIVKIIVFTVWAFYLIRFLNIKTIVYVTILLIVAFVGLYFAGIFDDLVNNFARSIALNSPFNEAKREAFLAGDYGRGAAVGYYLTSDVLVFGDGPSKYYDVLSSTYSRGNMGHAFTIYSEIGLIGWILSMVIFYLFAFQKGSWRRNLANGRIMIPWFSILIFICLIILSFTTHVMNDISVMLSYLLIAKAGVLCTIQSSSGEQLSNQSAAI